jgi:hypothetical protein
MKLLKMYGPDLKDPSKIVQRDDIPAVDQGAYELAGYTLGSIEVAAEVVAEAVAEEVETPAPAPVTRAKKTKAKPKG